MNEIVLFVYQNFTHLAIGTTEVFKESVEILAKMTADALPEHVVEPIGIIFIHQSIPEDSEHLVDPQSGKEHRLADQIR